MSRVDKNYYQTILLFNIYLNKRQFWILFYDVYIMIILAVVFIVYTEYNDEGLMCL